MVLEFDELVDRIYEAAAVPDLWASTLSEIGRFGEGVGALLFTFQGHEFRYVASPELEHYVTKFISEGWAARNDRPARLFSKLDFGQSDG